MGYRYSQDKDKKRGFAANMERIDKFCQNNGIRKSACSESYYFTINGQKYRVSNHSVEESNAKAYSSTGEMVRPLYHPEGELDDVIYIRAGKNKIIEIYKSIRAGKVPEHYLQKR